MRARCPRFAAAKAQRNAPERRMARYYPASIHNLMSLGLGLSFRIYGLGFSPGFEGFSETVLKDPWTYGDDKGSVRVPIQAFESGF